MSHTSALRRRLAFLAIGAATAVTAFAGSATSASALIPPSGLVNAPQYCFAIYGNPAPCPPPERPEPVDPSCLRVDVEPLMCPYQP